jgi:hypothetical protein
VREGVSEKALVLGCLLLADKYHGGRGKWRKKVPQVKWEEVLEVEGRVLSQLEFVLDGGNRFYFVEWMGRRFDLDPTTRSFAHYLLELSLYLQPNHPYTELQIAMSIIHLSCHFFSHHLPHNTHLHKYCKLLF